MGPRSMVERCRRREDAGADIEGCNPHLANDWYVLAAAGSVRELADGVCTRAQQSTERLICSITDEELGGVI